MRFEAEQVQFMPKELQPGVLYVSQTYGTAAHLCACGCRSKIRTPLGLTEWSIDITPDGPTLDPSVGNWQRACRSHYWIRRGEVVWAPPWTDEQVAAGREWEHERRLAYYEAREPEIGVVRRFWQWIRKLFARTRSR